MANVLGNSAFLGGVTQDDLNNYLPLTGGLVNGVIGVSGADFYANGYVRSSIRNYGSGETQFGSIDLDGYIRYLCLKDPTERNQGQGLLLVDIIDGQYTIKKIYGEHNVTCGTADLTAGTSLLESGMIYQVYV